MFAMHTNEVVLERPYQGRGRGTWGWSCGRPHIHLAIEIMAMLNAGCDFVKHCFLRKKLGKHNKAPQSSPIIIKGWYQKLMSHQIDLQIDPICQIFSCTMSSTVKKSNMNIWWYVHCSKLAVKDDKWLFNCPLLEPCGINHNHKSQKIIGGKFSAKKSETATHRV